MDKFDQIERVHLYACKRFLHVLDKTPNDIVYGELGRYPLWITSISKSIKYWFRLLKQPENFWSKKAYNMSLGLTRIKAVLCNNSFEQVWLFGCGPEGPFFKELRERLYSSFCHGWVNHMESSTRFSIYRQLKHCF